MKTQVKLAKMVKRDDLPYIIPMMKVRAELHLHHEYMVMLYWSNDNCKGAWLTKLCLDSTSRWFPEFYFDSKWDAAKFMKKFTKYM